MHTEVDQARAIRLDTEISAPSRNFSPPRVNVRAIFKELTGETSSSRFRYRVVAKRKGFESKRLDYCAAAETDSFLYPELREKEQREYEEELDRMKETSTRIDVDRVRMQ